MVGLAVSDESSALCPVLAGARLPALYPWSARRVDSNPQTHQPIHMKKKITVFAGDKGGVSKTTTSVILACGLGLPLRDLDPSRTGTRWLARRADTHPLPASEGQGWVADCPPGIRGELIPVLRESDLVLVPVRPGFTDLDVLAHTLRFVSAHAPGDIGFLLAGIDQRTRDEGRLRQALAPLGPPVLGVFSFRVAYARAGSSASLPGELDPVAAREAQELFASIGAL